MFFFYNNVSYDYALSGKMVLSRTIKDSPANALLESLKMQSRIFKGSTEKVLSKAFKVPAER